MSETTLGLLLSIGVFLLFVGGIGFVVFSSRKWMALSKLQMRWLQDQTGDDREMYGRPPAACSEQLPDGYKGWTLEEKLDWHRKYEERRGNE